GEEAVDLAVVDRALRDGDVLAARQHDAHDVGMGLAEARQQLRARHARHDLVRHHDVDRVRGQHLERGGRALGRVHVVRRLRGGGGGGWGARGGAGWVGEGEDGVWGRRFFFWAPPGAVAQATGMASPFGSWGATPTEVRYSKSSPGTG